MTTAIRKIATRAHPTKAVEFNKFDLRADST
jgi:hypothetical protein